MRADGEKGREGRSEMRGEEEGKKVEKGERCF